MGEQTLIRRTRAVFCRVAAAPASVADSTHRGGKIKLTPMLPVTGSETVVRRPIPAVGVVCLRGDEVLLIRRGQPPLRGAWSLPGGRIEWGERAADAALRELAEETGVAAELWGLIDVVDGLFPGDRDGSATHFVLIDYAARWLNGEPTAGDDAAEAAFHAIDALDGLDLWGETLRIIALAREKFGAAQSERPPLGGSSV